jgi:hypothetical protein
MISRFNFDFSTPPDRKHIEDIKKEICDETGLSVRQVKNVISHFCAWQRNSFSKAEYAEY